MSDYVETGPFDKPDPVTKNALFAEEKDTINKLEKQLATEQRNGKFKSVALVVMALVAGYGVYNSDTKYYMVDIMPDGRKTIYVPDKEYIPLNQTIELELADFIKNSRRITPDSGINSDMRWDALKMVQMDDKERLALFEESKLQLKEIYQNVTVLATNIETTNRGGNHWSVRWKETARDRRTGNMQSTIQYADIEAIYVKQSGDNPAGIMFSKPIVPIRTEKLGRE